MPRLWNSVLEPPNKDVALFWGHTRRVAQMVSNSVAIQTGTDPTTAAIAFFWGTDDDGSPDALFPDRGDESLWFGNGVRVDDRLVLFFARTLRGDGTRLRAYGLDRRDG